MIAHQVAYRAVETRDTRFDGQFVTAVRTTGIYCRPGCPARTPHRRNVDFFATSAAAQSAGYRACKRCLPDAVPGSPEWNLRADAVGAAMRLIADGVVDREGVPGLARRLGYSSRHLTRILGSELGAGPLSLARARRAHAARILLTSTSIPISEIAFASGFTSIRQFNHTLREVFGTEPSALRRSGPKPGGQAGPLRLRLPVRSPYDAAGVLAYLTARAIPGVESVSAQRYCRSLHLPGGSGTVELDFAKAIAAQHQAAGRGDRSGSGKVTVEASLSLTNLSDLAPAVERCRRLIDADADPVGIDALLGQDTALASSVALHPGIRVPGAVDGFEILLRAMLGQQVSVASARTTIGKLAARFGSPAVATQVPLLFPAAENLAELDPADLGGPRLRAKAIIAVSQAIARGDLIIDSGCRAKELAEQLQSFPGIGPWTAGYVVMRVLGDPDVLLTGDLVLRQGAAALGLPDQPAALTALADRWRPFRSYAAQHLWRAAPQKPSPHRRAQMKIAHR